jgi:Domain of unknown function (DUF4293)
MIQRIQSLYLSFIFLLSLFFLNGSFLSFIDKNGSVIKITICGIIKDTGGQGFEMIEKLLPLSLFIIFIPILSVITVLLFKNRKIQMWLALSLIVIIAVFIIASIHLSFITMSKFQARIIPGFKMFLPVIMLVLTVLAYRGIRKDDRLIKSYNRLR